MDYDLTLAEQAYSLAARWDASRAKDVKSLDFKPDDLESFDSNQKGALLSVYLEEAGLKCYGSCIPRAPSILLTLTAGPHYLPRGPLQTLQNNKCRVTL